MATIYKLNDMEWVEGSSLENAIDNYCQITGYVRGDNFDDEVMFGEARELSKEELDRYHFIDTEGCFGPCGEQYTFRKAFELHQQGSMLFYACSEY